jgi:hypothetical protein
VKKAWKALHFKMRLPKQGNGNTKSLAYTSVVRPILEYGAVCSNLKSEGQISALDQVQWKAAKLAHHRNDKKCETLVQRRKITRIYALIKTYTGIRAWKAIGTRLQKPCYRSNVDHDRKIRSRNERKAIGKYSFANRTIQLWNQLPADAVGTFSCKSRNFRRRVRKVIVDVKVWEEIIKKCSEVKYSEMKWSE